MTAEARRNAAIQSAWDFAFGKLWYPKTHQIYDYLTAEDLDTVLDTFPTPEEIRNHYPNPCGWGTGMEDSTLSMCPLLEAVLARYETTGDSACKQQADELMAGLILNGTVAPERGFIARAVSPVDGKSIYMDSSRDQYTNWVYAAHLLLRSDLADAEQKETLRRVLVWIGEKCRRDVKPETGGYLMRLDGKPGIVSRMDHENLGPHEFLRLPMFYMAAYEASGDAQWLNLCRESAQRLLPLAEKTFTLEYWRDYATVRKGYVYCIYQHQYSAKLLYDCETDAGWKARYLEMMRRAAQAAEFFLQEAYENIDAITVGEPRRTPWRQAMADSYNYGRMWENTDLFHGCSYDIPRVGDASRERFSKYLRNAAEAVIIQCLCPDFAMTETGKQAFLEFVDRCDFSGAATYWPVLFCDAWHLAKKSGQI